MVGREAIVKDTGGLIRFHPRYSFSDLEEAATVLAYGSFLEWKREKESHDHIQKYDHLVAFVTIGLNGITALVDLNPRLREEEENFRIKEISVAQLTFVPPTAEKKGSWKCTAILMSNVFNIPYGSGCIFYIHKKDQERFRPFSTALGERPKFIRVTMSMSISESGAKRQVDAINRLCGVVHDNELGYLNKWRPLLLNQHSGVRKVNDLATEHGLKPDTVTSAIDHIVSHGSLDWSEDKRECLRNCASFPGRAILIQGFPGAGKTFLIVGMSSVYLSLGIQVLSRLLATMRPMRSVPL
ncbi:hypothetical protein BO94DRAFT_312272 [Aspergillus sclerotioniger CBS 115572]|uniref:DNA2/NAM7 helicase helicase domain-containing protein n=1 Tax=Aspergillus sclerotioniger CBS 115572 TaxID=1450535 RepID=A0A317X5K2_9EURO|nr:hypothetical protein BO94DRAFT_312272 [Aspergillus sclerotioniger CBS 115572]PWY93886.1 hypothetical protein BO94DRAFT_312272 [Aspergillus sclerotioniger CBS 115572]